MDHIHRLHPEIDRSPRRSASQEILPNERIGDFNIFKGEFTRRFQPEVGEFCYDNLPVDTLGDDAITATKIAIDNDGYVYVK